MSRLRQAHEGLIQSRAQFLPQVSGSGGYSRSFDIAGASTVTLPDGTVTTISRNRSEEHTSELQSLMRISYAVFCLKKKNDKITSENHEDTHNIIKHQQTSN